MSIMSTCERCGGGIPAGAGTCPNCGAPASGGGEAWVRTDALPEEEALESAASAAQAASQPAWSEPEPAPAPAPVPPPPVYTPPTPGYSTPAAEIFTPGGEKKRSPWVWVIGCCAGALILLCCLLAVGIAAALAPVLGI